MNFPSFDGSVSSMNPSLFFQILLQELLESGIKVSEMDLPPETQLEEGIAEEIPLEDEVKVDVRESIEDMHDFDRFFSL